jgi:hypothetical protein
VALPEPLLLHGVAPGGATPLLLLLVLAAFVLVTAAVISSLQR